MIENIVVLEKTALEQIRPLVSCANLQAVRFTKFGLTLKPSTEGKELDVYTSSKAAGEHSEGGMLLTFDLRLQGKADEAVVLDIAARVVLEYALPANTIPSSTDMKLFARANGMLNVWPYWREFIQNSTLRAGLPPLTLPLFRVVPGSPSRT